MRISQLKTGQTMTSVQVVKLLDERNRPIFKDIQQKDFILSRQLVKDSKGYTGWFSDMYVYRGKKRYSKKLLSSNTGIGWFYQWEYQFFRLNKSSKWKLWIKDVHILDRVKIR